MITIKHSPINEIIEVNIEKNTSSLDFIKLYDFLEKNNTLSRFINILIKAPEGFENISYSQLAELGYGICNVIKKYDKVNIAMTVSKKREIELSNTFKNLISFNKCQFQVFKNTKAAKRWIRRQIYFPTTTLSHKYAG